MLKWPFKRRHAATTPWVTAPLFLVLNCVSVFAQATGVASVSITVSDLDKAKAFYAGVLDFTLIDEREESGDAVERLTGIFASRVRSARLQLGGDTVELVEFVTTPGRPVPADSRSNDRWFQHIAIAVGDIDRAYQRLREHKVRQVSPEPQTLPEWNVSAGGIRALYFNDPDGHVLELIQFPPGKGAARWRAPASRDRPFLGIDHTAIVVTDTERSLAFYRDRLGLVVVGGSENFGVEQERLNGVFGAHLRITTLRAPAGPGIELLEYITPSSGRDYPMDSRVNDLWHWHTKVKVADVGAALSELHARRISLQSPGDDVHAAPVIVRDPDGHALLLAPGSPSGTIAPSNAASKGHDDHTRRDSLPRRSHAAGDGSPRRRFRGRRVPQGVVGRGAHHPP